MLRELLGVCVPFVLQVPYTNPPSFRRFDEASSGWVARLFQAGEDKWLLKSGRHGGRVIGLSRDTITVRLRSRPPRTFPLAPPLLSDRIPFNPGPGMGYRLRDVQLGDIVDLDVVPVRDGFVCIGIGIGRRPGGVIPVPSVDEPHGVWRRKAWIAHQFAEEKVLPAIPRLVTRATGPLLKCGGK